MFQVRPNLYSRFLKPLVNCTITQRNNHIETKVKLSNGITINYVQTGKGDKNVLLMPGALGTGWSHFKPQIEKLPELLPNHTIIAWDPPGYGKSLPPERHFNLDFLQNDARCAVDLMRTIGRPKFSILGWSNGGTTAIIVAGRFVECVEKLVIWGACAYLDAELIKTLRVLRDVQKWSQRNREIMEKVYGVEGFPKFWSAWVDAADAIYKKRKGDFCCTEVTQIKAPTFILHGKKDTIIAAEHIPYLRERIKDCKYYEFPEGKHNIHLRYADEFNKLVAHFLTQKP
ncbi:valacyclovir hydrolase-like [Bactrocera neohumeralis]|uniref:valacyclovir hydrolase-like n=1 Tax=Bactrocera neohumeralis TaxID=98809 RepID=UPI0021655974|nr:valacyclovir hydrolase-like [Bactrocera neohumeralis]